MKSNKNSRILIAGHHGMVGSAIIKKLEEQDYTNLLLLDRDVIDLRDQSEVEYYFNDEMPEYVFLAAAKVGGILANNTYKAEFIYDNLAIAMNVINSAYKFNVKKLLNLGSSCIYPKNSPQPMKEDYLLTGELEPTNEPYAIAKITAIKLCRYYNEQYGTNFISVMPTNLFGFNDNFNLETSHVLPALIRKSILAKALADNNFDLIIKDLEKNKLGFGLDDKIDKFNNQYVTDVLSSIGISAKSINVWGSGNVKREFLFTDNMADACVFLMENFQYSDIGEFVNIGTGEDITIKNLINLINSITGFSGEVVFDIDKPEGTKQKLLDVSRINSLGWKHSISLEEGIKIVVDNYLSAY